MSGVQVDNSPAVATRLRDVSSWKEEDLSALTSSEKKRYYRRKSAVKAYFTTEEALDQIALHYHLPTKMVEKLAKRCLMQHEDSAPWGFRALLPGIHVVDHMPAADATHEHEDVTATDAIHEDVIHKDAMYRVPTDPESGGEDIVGTRLIASTTPAGGASALAGNAAPATIDEAMPTIDSDDTSATTVTDDATVITDDNEDTAERHAIVLPPETPTLADDMPDITGIEEADTAREVEIEDKAGNAEETPVVTDKSESATSAAIEEEIPCHPSLRSESALSDDEILRCAQDDKTDSGQKYSPDEEPAIRDAGGILPENDTLTVPEQHAEPIIIESTADTVDAAEASVEDDAINPIPTEAELVPDTSERDSTPLYLPEFPRKTSRSLVVRGQVLPATLPRASKKRPLITGKRAVIAKRSIRKRWVRNIELSRRRRSNKVISAVVVAVLFLSLLIPVGAGIAAYSAYNSIKGIALDGVNHLMNVKTLLPASKTDLTAALNPEKLQQADQDFTQAQSDFLQLQGLMNRPDIQSLVQQFAPQYSSKLGMAQHLVQVGIDVTHMGSELISIAMMGANILHGPLLASGATTPLITTGDISTIEGTMLHCLYYIQDIKTQMSQVTLNQLPISASQQKEIASAMTLLPKAQSYIEQGQGMIGIVSWLLGIGQPRRFLVQTMDRAELRPSGGFTGQYGVFTIQDGRVAPFTLQDVTELDYNGNGAELGRQAPPGYTSWMNFGNFGLRDSNLSGDFPTTARLAMQVFEEEGGGPVDGDIMFTTTAIAHVLDVVGPIKIPEYNDTITAQNLEDKLHYYQNDPAAIALQKEKTNTNNAASRKSFTALVGKKLLDTVRHLPVKTLLKVAQNAQKDIASRDLEIYFSNPQAESWLVTHNFSGAMNTFSGVDGFMVVQSNISISKASSDVQTTEQDNIVLDPQGGATHNLTITLDYRGTKPIYSTYTTYADYIRVYAPANAVFESGYGFDTGKALCTPTPPGGTTNPTKGTGGPTKPPSPTGSTPPLPGCDQMAKSYGNNALYCPSGNYSMGPRGWVQGKGFSNWSFDTMGAPTEMTSDLPGRAMWGGLTVTPKNCISTITLSWYVPNAVKHVAGQPLYSVLVQKQGGYIPLVQISIDTSQLQGVKPYSFSGGIDADRLFSLAVVKKTH